MVICHYDRTGEKWLYKLPCNRIQAFTFACFLRTLRNLSIKPRHAYHKPQTETDRANRAFCSQLEQDVLQALYNRYPATEDDYSTEEFFIL